MGFSKFFSSSASSHRRSSSAPSLNNSAVDSSATTTTTTPQLNSDQPTIMPLSALTKQSIPPTTTSAQSDTASTQQPHSRLKFQSNVPMKSLPSKHVRLRVHIDVPTSSPFLIELPLSSSIQALKLAIYESDLTRGPARIIPGLTAKGKLVDLAHMRLYATVIPWEAWYQSKVYSDYHEKRVNLLVHFKSILITEDQSGPKNVAAIWGPDAIMNEQLHSNNQQSASHPQDNSSHGPLAFFKRNQNQIDTSKGDIHIIVRILPFGPHTLTLLARFVSPSTSSDIRNQANNSAVNVHTPDTPTYPSNETPHKEQSKSMIPEPPLSPENSDSDGEHPHNSKNEKSRQLDMTTYRLPHPTSSKDDYYTPILIDVDTRSTIHTLKYMLLTADGRNNTMLDRIILSKTDTPYVPSAAIDRFDEPIPIGEGIPPEVLRDSGKKISEAFPLPALSSVTDRVQILVEIHESAQAKLARAEEFNHIPPFAYPAPLINRAGLKPAKTHSHTHANGTNNPITTLHRQSISAGGIRKSISLGDIRMLNGVKSNVSRMSMISVPDESPPHSSASSVFNVPLANESLQNLASSNSSNQSRASLSDSDSLLRKLAVVNLAKNRPNKKPVESQHESNTSRPLTLVVDSIDVDEDIGFAI